MACDGYNKTALMGNWYEERVAVPQPFRDEKDFRSKREEEDAISYVTHTNVLKPLGTINRVHPWNTASVIVDDGFREYKTINKTMMDPALIKNYKNYQDCRPLVKTVEQAKRYPEGHTSIQTNQSKQFSLLTQENMQKHATEINRNVKMNITDFGSTFKRHVPDHERLFNMTTNQQFYDRPQNPTVEQVIEKDGARLKAFAGSNKRPDHLQGIKMTSPLIGEVYKTQKDPQQNTIVQRSWLPYAESALKSADDNMKKSQQMDTANGFKTSDKLGNYKVNNAQALPYDIATSLPLADGMHSLKSKYLENGSFRRIGTDVTRIRNKPLTKK
jgi:hypothetical protein